MIFLVSLDYGTNVSLKRKMTRRRATMNLVTNIQKYSIHDGDGIRTTVIF